MARAKKGRDQMPAVTQGRATKPVRLDLSPELHQMLRVVAAEQGKPMAVFARELVERTVRELHGARKGRP